MKILQLIPNISGGGAERFTVDLSNELTKDHEVHLVTLYASGKSDLFRQDLSNKIRTHFLNKQLGFDWRVIARLIKLIKEIKPDIIHSHLRSFNYLMPIIPFLGKTPVVHTVHSDAFEECSHTFIRQTRRVWFKLFNILPVTISKASRYSFEKAYGLVDQNLIYNGRKYPAKTESFEIVQQEINNKKNDSDTKVFVHIGRLEVEKNQMILVKAFNQLVYENDANAILFIIGGRRNSEASKGIYEKLVRTEQEHDHIHILGERPNATDYLHAADFFCLSSLYEGMPITLIEAFATGTIPVCTPVGGVPEMVSELDTSLLSVNITVNDYYKTLKTTYEINEDKKRKMKDCMNKLFKRKYSISSCKNEYCKLYKKLCR